MSERPDCVDTIREEVHNPIDVGINQGQKMDEKDREARWRAHDKIDEARELLTEAALEIPPSDTNEEIEATLWELQHELDEACAVVSPPRR